MFKQNFILFIRLYYVGYCIPNLPIKNVEKLRKTKTEKVPPSTAAFSYKFNLGKFGFKP